MENSNSKQFVVLERIAGENARDYVKRVLLYNLTELILKPGEQIQDIEICEKLGVSRTPVREAILEFSQFNMIDIFPRRGMRVALIDPVKCEDGRYLRCLVEADLSEQACDLINAQFLEKFHVSVSLLQYYEKKDFYKFFEYDIEFHKLLYLLCNKEYLYNLVSRACMHFDRLRRLRFLINDPKVIVSEHEELLDAIENHNKEKARQIAEYHLRKDLYDITLLLKHFPEYFES